ncbi:FitA-like ribbon-helix-helix domain-containing protein [Rubinisphaera margarita]|uniref:FitA-like ribbon-helix-helix domain-containing protein n=1 Tax=Rubinisphaera margarita TaxID=2909586 RepID=UPI001EE96A3D|nr:ribbon-helix-helix protein, CopG family [Rubinisphaera margarita]MCG6157639.1 ribbon-helix-helix protein, CopG family [Rubinisphaera margarita]
MAQFMVRNLEDDVHERLKELARRQGRSFEDMVRDILRNAILRQPEPRKGLGTRLAERFAKHKLDKELPELPRQNVEPQSFER